MIKHCTVTPKQHENEEMSVEIHIKTPKTKTRKGIYEEDNTKNEHHHKYKNEIPTKDKPRHIKKKVPTIKIFTRLEYKYYTRK
jgi:hypothetical protein